VRLGDVAETLLWTPHQRATEARRPDAVIRDPVAVALILAGPPAPASSLGEGPETGFWRVDDGTVQWVGVDLPEVIALRRPLLPASDRWREVACSATDPGGWTRWTRRGRS
jgi:O-methyltransferase involved in polyketide biosynthesis